MNQSRKKVKCLSVWCGSTAKSRKIFHCNFFNGFDAKSRQRQFCLLDLKALCGGESRNRRGSFCAEMAGAFQKSHVRLDFLKKTAEFDEYLRTYFVGRDVLRQQIRRVYIAYTPQPLTVTTRIVMFLVRESL